MEKIIGFMIQTHKIFSTFFFLEYAIDFGPEGPKGPRLGPFSIYVASQGPKRPIPVTSRRSQGAHDRALYILFALWYRQVPEHEAQENEIVYHVCDPKIHDIKFHSLGPRVLGLVDTKVQNI
eukprot:UN24320